MDRVPDGAPQIKTGRFFGSCFPEVVVGEKSQRAEAIRDSGPLADF